MKHRSSQTLFAHWAEMRGKKAAPERSDIDPGAIRTGLGDVFILSFNRLRGHPFRLAGTRVCAIVGKELKDQSFAALWLTSQEQEILRLIELIANESVGIVAGVSGQNPDGQPIDIEMTLLPLQHWGRTHARLIGALAPLNIPYWFGTQPIGALTLGDYRYVGMRALPPASALTLPRGDARVRRGLVVYDGGQR
jgi:hypothetical protein